MATNHVLTSELPYFQSLEVWAKKNLSEEEFEEFEKIMQEENFNLVNHVYERWVIDQKITHEYTDVNGNTVTVAYTSLNNTNG
jgi:hypothetical protein